MCLELARAMIKSLSRAHRKLTMALAGPYESVRLCANHKLSDESQVAVNEV